MNQSWFCYAQFSGRIAEYDEPSTLIKREGSLFGQLVKEYWSHSPSAEWTLNLFVLLLSDEKFNNGEWILKLFVLMQSASFRNGHFPIREALLICNNHILVGKDMFWSNPFPKQLVSLGIQEFVKYLPKFHSQTALMFNSTSKFCGEKNMCSINFIPLFIKAVQHWKVECSEQKVDFIATNCGMGRK